MRLNSEQRLRAAAIALEVAVGPRGDHSAVVDMHIDQHQFVASFELDQEEHLRRHELGLGPVTNTGLLHALWSIPEGTPMAASALDERDRLTLRELGDGHVQGSAMLIRRYLPPGQITAVIAVAETMDQAVTRASWLPPIYWRIATAWKPTRHTGEGDGIGAVLIAAEPVLVVEPEPPILGVPAVYRWWMSELAYRNWAAGNCAHCSS